MAKTETKINTPVKNGIRFGDKFGLDKERKKLGASDMPNAKPVPIYSPGENFSIVKIVMTKSKKKYSAEDEETGEQKKGLIDIAQIDVIKEDGTPAKFYSGNKAIVQSCEAIINDADFKVMPDGTLGVPCIIASVIEGVSGNFRYIAFES
jgi:hypothetical protein